MNPSFDFEAFRSEALAQGFDEVMERRWEPHQVLDTHTHPFAVRALVVQGELRLGCRGSQRLLKPGDRFELTHSEPHTEHYGPEGATYWVARRHAA